MKNTLKFCLIFFSTSALFTGCYTTSFLPQSQNVPLFTKEKEVRINPTHSLRAFDLQLAYAPINHMGIIANVQATPRYYMAEIGAGAFHSSNNFLVTEIYLGLGTGRLKDSIIYHDTPILPSDDRYLGIDMTAYKIFLQPNLGIKFSEKMNLSFSAKCIYWHYPNYYYNYERWERVHNSSGPPSVLAYEEKINAKNVTEITIEPAITFRAGGEHTKFMFQAGASAPIRTGNLNLNPYRYNEGFIRMGVCVNFELFKKENSQQSSQ